MKQPNSLDESDHISLLRENFSHFLGAPTTRPRVLSTFGGAPMFLLPAAPYVLMVGYKILLTAFGPNQGTRFGVSPDHFGVVWLVTMLMIPALCFPCRAFARYKRRAHRAWVRYF